MSDRDAFVGEMGFRHRIRDEDAERLLSGFAPAPGRGRDLDEVASFLTAIRVVVPARPDPGREVPLVRRLASAAEAAGDAVTDELARTPAGGGAWRPRVAMLARVSVAVALVPVVAAGLAFAGVRLPEPARSALHSVGVELPNQSEGGDTSSADEDAGADDGQASQSRSGENGSAAAEGASSEGERAKHGRHHRGDRDHGPAPGGGGSGTGGGGPAGVPPGQGGTPPGQGGTPPGQSATPPGQGGTPPGQGGTIPGSGSGGQSAEPRGGGASSVGAPGQAKKIE